ncbi:MAG: hypothetical protein MHM6MM_003127 [Cercozoa sp. M6MM]
MAQSTQYLVLGTPQLFQPSRVLANPIAKKICDLIYLDLKSAKSLRVPLEFELRFGTLLDRQTEEKLDRGTSTPAALKPSFNECFFKSGVDSEVWAKMRQYLQQWCDRVSVLPDLPQEKRVKHLGMRKTKDLQYQGRVRVTIDASTDETVACVMKKKRGVLNVLQPEDYDWRIGSATETDAPMPPSDTPIRQIRVKSRESWQFDGLRIDLTDVITHMPDEHVPKEPGEQVSRCHEIELEIVDTALLQRIRDAIHNKKPLSELAMLANVLATHATSVTNMLRSAKRDVAKKRHQQPSGAVAAAPEAKRRRTRY